MAGLSVPLSGLPQQGQRAEFPLSGLDPKWDTRALDLALQVVGYFDWNLLKTPLGPKDLSAHLPPPAQGSSEWARPTHGAPLAMCGPAPSIFLHIQGPPEPPFFGAILPTKLSKLLAGEFLSQRCVLFAFTAGTPGRTGDLFPAFRWLPW